jgi:Bacterial Ig-like domain (group 1)
MNMLKTLASLFLMSVLAACGGGGGDSGTPGFGSGSGGGTGNPPTTGKASLLVSISTTTVSSTDPGTVTAAVRDSAGLALSGQVVSFSTVGGLGSFNVSTALTDSTGVATVKLSPASPSANGADLVVARSAVNGGDLSGTIGFQVSAVTAPVVGTPSLVLSLSSTSVTAASPATVTATVKDAAGNPVANQVVKFSSVDPIGSFNPSSALTDASGAVSVKLTPSGLSTNGAALAVAVATVSGVQLTSTAGFTATSSGAIGAGSPSLALTLSNSIVTTAVPVNAVAVVRDGAGAAVAGQVVKFKTVDGLGTFAVSSALTDSTGTASASLSAAAAGQSGADQVIVTTAVNGMALQATQGFQLTATNATISGFISDKAVLLPYEQANLTVNVAGSLPGTPVNLSLTSTCVASGKATLTPATSTTTTGSATFTYRDAGCGATNTSDSLQVNIVGTSATRALNLDLTAPTVNSITFTSATPTTIFLKSSGLTETSTLVYTVVDTAGNGLPNQTVTLELLTAAGGLTLDGGQASVAKKTDSFGRVSALINSGTVPTPVRVKATLSNGINSVSSGLAVAVGLPSELNFSLSQTTRNIEGYDIDGTANVYSIIASDRLANPVPVGTAINFIAEGGQIEPIKNTALASGLARASANFVSASPRPLDGRVTVLAYALGEESFLDTNGNNVWDAGIDTQFQDLGAVFLSRKYLGTYFAATDQLIPLSISGVGNASPCIAPTSPLLNLNASIPTAAGSTCDSNWGRAYVRRAAETVLSTSVSRPVWESGNLPSGLSAAPGSCPKVTDTVSSGTGQNLIVGYADGTGLDPAGTEIRNKDYYRVGGPTTIYNMNRVSSFSFLVADRNPVRLNPVAAGSVIEVTVSGKISASVVGGSPVPNSSEPTFASISVDFGTTETDGTVNIKITSPSGLTTVISQPVSTRPTPVGESPCP